MTEVALTDRCDGTYPDLTSYYGTIAEFPERFSSYLGKSNRYKGIPRHAVIDVGELVIQRRKKATWSGLYVVAGPPGAVKIGVSECIQKRMSTLQTGSPYPLTLLAASSLCFQMEGWFHRVHQKDQLSGEWFRLSPKVAGSILGIQLMEWWEHRGQL